ncbi:C25 family cysteine peptidase [Ahniella affigens]|nr:C25 family cysteine peptidase [Ahniella affigens]
MKRQTASNRTWLGRMAGLCALFLAPLASAQVIYTYNNTTTGTIPETTTTCATVNTLVRTFTVTETFTVANVALGLDITHDTRGQLRVYVTPPGSGEVTMLNNGGDTNNNYNIMLSTNNEADNTSDDGDADTNGTFALYRRLVTNTNAVNYTGAANGTWTIRICDTDGAGAAGSFNSARLVLRSAETFPAACSAGNTISFDWGALGEEVAFTNTTVSGVTLSQGTTSGEAPTDDAASTSFRTRTTVTGNHTGYYTLRMNTNTDTESSLETTRLNFSEPVHGLTFNLLDVDWTNNSWEDYVRVEAVGPSGEARSTQVVPANAQNAYAGDWMEPDIASAATETFGNIAYTFSGPVSYVIIQYAQGNEPQTNSASQFVGVADFGFCAYDFGDGPTSYGTTLAASGARHSLSYRNLFMGTAPDGDADGLPGAAANGDGADEDGVTLPTKLGAPSPGFQCGSYVTAAGEFCVRVNVTNSLATAAQLVAWLDANGDGDFADANERSIPRLQGGTGGAGDNLFATGNIPAGFSGTVTLIWSGLTSPVTTGATYVRARLTSDPLFFSDTTLPASTGLVRDGEVEDVFLPAGTLPVTLAYVQSSQQGQKLSVNFTTTTETNNVGFSIVERVADGSFKPLHAHLIPSKLSNSTDVSQYAATDVNLPANGQFYIMDHDIYGQSSVRGPFVVGTTQGQQPNVERINWSTTCQAVAAVRQSRVAAPNKATLWVAEKGFYRVTAAALQSAGIDFSAAPADQLAVTYLGKPVPVRVVAAGNSFSGSAYLDFFAEPTENLYTSEMPFELSVNAQQHLAITADATVATVDTPAWYWAESVYAPNRFYNFASPTEDPWYADRLLAYPNQPASLNTSLSMDAVMSTPDFHPELSAKLIGVTNWPDGGQDHHVQLTLAGQMVAEARFDGVSTETIRSLQPLLGNGTHAISVTATGNTGFAHDLNYLESISLRYPRQPVAISDRLFVDALQSSFTRADEWDTDEDSGADRLHRSGFEASAVIAGLRVQNLSGNDVVAYIGRGDSWRWLSQAAVEPDGSMRLPSESGSSYFVSTVAAIGVPRIESVAVESDIQSGQADYLIIAHPSLISALQPLVQYHQNNGLTVKVVDVTQVYAQYAHYVPEGKAIQDYLDAVVPSMGVNYVLLVGGDTYDYKNYLGTGSVSLIPTQYGQTDDVVRYAPLDGLYADVNRDGAPEFSLGRLPVRTSTELSNVISKIIGRNNALAQRNLVLAAPVSDSEGDFDAVNDDLAAALPGAWTTTRAYGDQGGAATARSNLLAAMAANPTVLSYVGHSAPTQWSFDPMLTASDITSGSGQTSDLVVQSGCWNSYFVSPTANTMAHAFLLTPGKGSAAVIGVTSLTSLASHQALGELLYGELAAGTRIGDALRLAKMQRAAQGFDPILWSATLLGDPAMPIR